MRKLLAIFSVLRVILSVWPRKRSFTIETSNVGSEETLSRQSELDLKDSNPTVIRSKL